MPANYRGSPPRVSEQRAEFVKKLSARGGCHSRSPSARPAMELPPHRCVQKASLSELGELHGC